MAKYTLTQDELDATQHSRGHYMWADIVYHHLDGDTLTLDNMAQHAVCEAIEAEGLGLLNDRTGLYQFLIYLEPV